MPAGSILAGRRRLLAAAAGSFGLAFLPAGKLGAQARRGSSRHALTVYFTRTGNTRQLAEAIHRQVGGDLIRVETLEAYPEDYQATVQQARRERDSGRWPSIRPRIADIRRYDMIFLGSPIWGDHLNPPMKRFLADHDLAGLRIAPFVTYKVSRMGQVRRNVMQIAPRARLLDGLAVRDDAVAPSKARAKAWARRALGVQGDTG